MTRTQPNPATRSKPTFLAATLALAIGACTADGAGEGAPKHGGSGGGGGSSGGSADGGGYGGSSGAGGAGGSSPDAGGSFGGVGVGGGQDFAAFRRALDEGKIPGKDSIEATGFFAEHYTSLPDPTCGQTFCLHGMLSRSKDLARGGDWTLLQMGMNSPVDPDSITKPPLDLAVVLDRSGSMSGAGKMDYAHTGLKLLVDALGYEDTLTFISFDDKVETHYGPAAIGENKEKLKAIIDGIGPRGGTNIYAGLEAGYKAALSVGDETQQRRVMFLTDGVATVGTTDRNAIAKMSAGYNDQYIGLSTIGLGSDADVGLLRALAEQGAGNFYFAEKVEAVTEVFTEELAFFVAPIAYDLELTFSELPSYALKEVFGTALWKATPGGGKVRVPSVFLVSRKSSDPGPSGGRRGGGSAIIADLGKSIMAPAGVTDVAQLDLRYRMPGSTTFETQSVTVQFDDTSVPDGGYYANKSVEKNTIILNLFVAFRDAVTLAQKSPAMAYDYLVAFQPKITARIEGLWTDEDLKDDLRILGQFIGILKKAAGR